MRLSVTVRDSAVAFEVFGWPMVAVRAVEGTFELDGSRERDLAVSPGRLGPRDVNNYAPARNHVFCP